MMNILNRWTRSAGALAAAAAVVSLGTTVATAGAAPVRTATTTSYNDATYLQHALDLPASDTSPAIEPVTFDRFQWLLQQSGSFAFLIGDPAEDTTFKARAQDVEAAAQAAHVKKVYWFDPNLSGNAHVGGIVEPNLDIRDPAGITALAGAAPSLAKYDNAWLSLVGSYLGDGVTVVQSGLNSENATVTITKGVTTAINDAGLNDGSSTEVGDPSGGALYDYTTHSAAYSQPDSAPANVSDSFFFIYNKAHTSGGQPAKIVAWTDLTTQASSTSATDDVGAAIATGGGSSLAELDQFAWWKSEVDAKQATQGSTVADGANVPVLTDADNADGWRVDQVTYPELVDLLKNDTDRNAVILFGGTWCPNTRPVLPFINRYAQQNDVHVFNFDTVLDGGLVGGSTTSASDPLQSRNTAPNGGATQANPSFLYGDLVNQYLNNLKTEYDQATEPTDPAVTYYPGGDTSGTPTLTSIKKLQVPYLVGYQGTTSSAPHGGVTRQWIAQNADSTYTEYMSQWWYTNPQPNQLGLSIPLGAPIWSTINAALASFTWQTDPTPLYPNTTVETDDTQYLVDADTATVAYTPVNGSTPAKVTVTSAGANPIPINPGVLATALAALGGSAPANLAAAKTALIAAETASSADTTLIGNLSTVAGAWGVAETRKNNVLKAWGNATSPGSVSGGLNAVHALDVFFGGLPGGVVSRRTVTADPVTSGTAPKIAIAIANDYGRTPTGAVSLVVKQGGTTVASASTAVAQDAATFTLPVLNAGTYDYTLSYAGDDQLLGFTETGSLTVSPAADTTVVTPPSSPPVTTTPPAATPPAVIKPVTKAKVKASRVKGVVAKAPTSKKAGKLKVTITVPKGASTPSGKVTVKLKKGKTTKTVTGKLSHGVVTVTLPKLARGTWKVTISWPGDTHYLKASVAGPSIKVKR